MNWGIVFKKFFVNGVIGGLGALAPALIHGGLMAIDPTGGAISGLVIGGISAALNAFKHANKNSVADTQK